MTDAHPKVTNQYNPFPASAVARTDTFRTVGANIATEASLQLGDFMQGFISERRGQMQKGASIAIVGEYGTGKTHLAVNALGSLASADESNLHIFYLDSPGTSFLALYRERFIPKLDRAEVLDRIVEYFADIVLEGLTGSPLTDSIVSALRQRTVDPRRVVSSLGLIGSEYDEILSDKLSKLTESSDFGVALSLFMRPEYESAVWEWLCGADPDPVLREFGVISPIDSDSAALDAFGVFAVIFGGQEHQLALVIDEVERILSPTGDTLDAGVLRSFKRLLELVARSGALLILAGLPDFMEVLPEDARQRISLVLRPSILTGKDVVEYIRAANEKAFGERTLTPFSREVANYIADLSGGNARRTVRLCYLAYQSAGSKSTSVTAALVRDVARAQFETQRMQDVLAEIVRVLDRRGLVFERGVMASSGKGKGQSAKVDVSVRLTDDGSTCAVFLTDSLLLESELRRFKALGALREPDGPLEKSELVLVINGYLAESLRASVERVFARVLTFNAPSFADDFDAVVSGVLYRARTGEQDATLGHVHERLDQLSRQSLSILDRIDDVSMNLSAPQNMQVALQQAVLALVTGQGGRSSSDPRFVRANRAVDRVLVPLDQYCDASETVVHVLLTSRGDPREVLKSRHPEDRFISQLLEPGAMRSHGCLVFARNAVRTFSAQLTQELQLVASASLGRSASLGAISDRDLVRELCQAMDLLISEIMRGEGEAADLLLREAVGDYARRESLGSSLMDLGRDVYFASQEDLDGLLRRHAD